MLLKQSMICVSELHKVRMEKQELATQLCDRLIHLNIDPSFEASYLGTSQIMTDPLI